MTYKTFVDGVVLPASDLQMLMDQSVIAVPNPDALTTIPTPANGVVAFVQSLNVHVRRITGGWAPIGGRITVADPTALANFPFVVLGLTARVTSERTVWEYGAGGWKRTANGRPILARATTSEANAWATVMTAFKWGGSPATPIVDTDAFFNSAQNTRLTVPFDGLYRIDFNLLSSGVLSARAGIFVNGSSTETYVTGSSFGQAGAGTNPQGSGVLALSAGDYIELRHVSPSTGSGAWNAAACGITIEYLGEA